jgi:hypothetical protein
MKTLSLLIATAVISLSIIFGPDIRQGVNLGLAQAYQEDRQVVEARAYDLFRRECSFPATWQQDWCREEYVKRVWHANADGTPCAPNDPRMKEPLPDWLIQQTNAHDQ